MKKNRFFWASAAIAALTLTACADQDEFNQNDVQTAAIENSPGAIQFGTYLGKEGTTRAIIDASYEKGTIGNKTDAVQGLTDLKLARFGVFGYYTGDKSYRAAIDNWGTSGTHWKATETNKYPNFFYNQQLMFDDITGKNAWVYEPVKYWPNGIDAANTDAGTDPNVDNTPSNTATEGAGYKNQKLSFFAFAPYTAAATTDYTTPTGEADPTGVTAVTTANDTKGVTAISKNNSPTDVWVKYLMPYATATEAVDLLWGLAGKDAYKETDGANPAKTIGSDYNENLTKQIVGERVKFLFKHALAKIGGATADGDEATTGNPLKGGLKVVADVDDNSETPKVNGTSKQGTDYFPTDFTRTTTLITLKSVKIQDGGSAAADASTGVYGTSLKSTLLTRGWFDIETGKWCEDAKTFGYPDTGGAEYNIEAKYDDDDVNDNTTYSINEAIREPAPGFEFVGASGLANAEKTLWNTESNTVKGVNIGTPQDVFADENVPALLFIPTGQGTDETNQKIYITVDYLVRTIDKNLSKGYSEVEQVITNEIILNGQDLDPNKYYTLVMHLGMTSVKFAAVVADWSTNTADQYNEDGTLKPNPAGEDEAEEVWLPSNVIKNQFSAAITGGNFFKNTTGDSKVVTATLTVDGVETAQTIDDVVITYNDGSGWLTWDGSAKTLATAADNNGVGAKDRTAVVTVKVAATATQKAYSQDIIVTQYGNHPLTVTLDPVGTGAGGNVPATAGSYTIKVTQFGNVVNIDDLASVTSSNTSWLTWNTGTKKLDAVANTGIDIKTAVVTATYTDAVYGTNTGTLTVKQDAAKLEATLTTSELEKGANSVSSELAVTFNGISVIDDANLSISIAYSGGDPEWLVYNSEAHTFQTTMSNAGGSSARTATVTITYGALSTTVTVTQKNS